MVSFRIVDDVAREVREKIERERARRRARVEPRTLGHYSDGQFEREEDPPRIRPIAGPTFAADAPRIQPLTRPRTIWDNDPNEEAYTPIRIQPLPEFRKDQAEARMTAPRDAQGNPMFEGNPRQDVSLLDALEPLIDGFDNPDDAIRFVRDVKSGTLKTPWGDVDVSGPADRETIDSARFAAQEAYGAKTTSRAGAFWPPQASEGAGIADEFLKGAKDIASQPLREYPGEPYVREGFKHAGGAVAEVLGEYAGQQADDPERRAEIREQYKRGGEKVGEFIAPRTYADLILELAPGVGTVPGVSSAARKLLIRELEREGLPLTSRGVRTLAERRGVSLAALKGETGSVPVGGPFGLGDDAEKAGSDGLERAGADLTPSDVQRGAEPEIGTPARSGEQIPVDREAPTIREIEGRSKPLTPEQRARIPRDTEDAFYQPPDFNEATAKATERPTGGVSGALQSIQDVAQKIPMVRSLFYFAEPTAGARAQRALGNIIPEAIVRRDVFTAEQQAAGRAGLFGWMERARTTLGMDGKGVAHDVGVRPGAEIPKGARGRIDDIVEHPEDYVLSPEQAKVIREADHTFNAVTQRQLEAGVDVREVEAGYFPRVVKSSPKGEPKSGGRGSGLVGRPGHAKAREFNDLREGIEAGYEYENPIEAMQHRLDTGIDSIGKRRTLETVKELGEKPSERVPQALRDAYLDAKKAYKADRSITNEKALEQAKRELRVAAAKANEPKIGEVKAFGRIFPQSVQDEIARYTDVSGPNAIEEFFRVQRASTTTGDLSAAFVQGGNLAWRNPVAWMKALGYSIASTARTPLGYAARNADIIKEGIESGAIRPPSEFLLRGAGNVTEALGRAPIAKQAQRAFEWMIFVGQTEWYKGAKGMAKSPEQLRELGAVIRKGTGSMARPGLTTRMRKAQAFTFFAGEYAMAVNGLAADALRGGVRGAEARRTLGSMIAGATALTIAGQLATDGTMPNLTNPRDRDKPWLSIKRPGGTVNLFGPLYPYIRAYASIAQAAADGDANAAADDLAFLARGRASLPLAAILDLMVYREDVVGNEIETGPPGIAKYLAERFVPLSGRSLFAGTEISRDGVDISEPIESLREFPEGLLTGAGLRTNRASDYRQKVNAAEPYIEAASGNYREAMKAAVADENTDAQDIIKSEWRKKLRPTIEGLGITIIPGKEGQGPRLEFTKLQTGMLGKPGWQQAFRDELKFDVAGATTRSEARRKYIAEKEQAYAKKHGVTPDEARDELGTIFDQSEVVAGTWYQPINKDGTRAKNRERRKDGFDDVFKDAVLNIWKKEPILFWDAVAVGWEDDSAEERKAIPR